MRITQTQLRRIIREERARLREGFDPGQLMGMGAGGPAFATALEEVRGDWMMMGEGDPMWSAQVDAAIGSLAETIANSFDEVAQDLESGTYAARGRV